VRSVTSFQEPLPCLPRPPRIPQRSSESLPGERLVRRYDTRTPHLSASVTCQKSPRAQWWSRAITSKSSSTNIIKAAQEKGIGPTYGFIALSRGEVGGHCHYPTDRVPMCTRFKRSASRLQICSWCQGALAPPRASKHRARHPPGEGSGVTTCPMA
jgi:hypothetical protein